MRDYIEFDTSPVNEDCIQVSKNDEYLPQMLEEAMRYKKFIEELFPITNPNNKIGIKKCEHDFGAYYEVLVFFDDLDEDSAKYAYDIENNLPLYWTDTIEDINKRRN